MKKPKLPKGKKLHFYILSAIAIVLAALAATTFPDTQKTSVSPGELYVTFADVGQGDATLIKTPLGETVLIDGGEYDVYDSHLLPFLQEQGIDSVDMAIATHYHSDHMGGIQSLTDDGMVKKLMLPDYEDTDKSKAYLEEDAEENGTEIEYIAAGDIVETTCSGLSIEVLHPLKGGSEGSNFHNNSSLVLSISYYGTTFLVTGDIEARAEKELLSRSDIECDVLKVPHHGSSSSSSEEFLEAADPTYAIISAGTDNSYGHPHYEVLDRLENDDVMIYRTDKDGDITFRVTEKGIDDISFSKTEKEGGVESWNQKILTDKFHQTKSAVCISSSVKNSFYLKTK